MEQAEINEIWNRVQTVLKDKISEAAYTMWVQPLVPHSFDGGNFVLLTGNNLTTTFLDKNKKEILEAFKTICGKEILYNIIYDEDLRKKLEEKAKKADKEYIKNYEKQLNPSKYDNLKQMQSDCRLNLKYKFENFVAGAGNKFAYAAALAAAQNPGAKYNPLFIYGGSGLGKTHLLQAIGHYILFNRPELKVKYIKAEEFVNDIVNALAIGGDKADNKNRSMNAFRNKYRNTDVLLIDDIQIIEGKKRTEDEMYNTFDSLYNSGKQIVFASDRPPEKFENSPARLKTRFQQGLSADIQPPDLETRMAILIKLAEYNKIQLSMEVISFLASVFSRNVRELEGAFNKTAAFSSINNMPVTVENVKKLIGYKENRKIVTAEGILDIVSSFYNIPIDVITGSNREAPAAKARNITAYLIREMTNGSFPAIGRFLNRKHPAVMHSCEKIKSDIAYDKRLAQEINELTELINS